MSDHESYVAASEEIRKRLALCLRKMSRNVRVKYQLSDYQMDLARSRGAGLLTIELAQIADVPLGELKTPLVC